MCSHFLFHDDRSLSSSTLEGLTGHLLCVHTFTFTMTGACEGARPDQTAKYDEKESSEERREETGVDVEKPSVKHLDKDPNKLIHFFESKEEFLDENDVDELETELPSTQVDAQVG